LSGEVGEKRRNRRQKEERVEEGRMKAKIGGKEEVIWRKGRGGRSKRR
jgi:hypothetical protein